MNPNDNEPHRKGGLRAGSVILMLVLALVCGLGGGLLARFIPLKGVSDNPTVTFQTAPATATTGAAVENMSIAQYVAASATASVVEVTTEYKMTSPFVGSFVMSGAGSGVVLSADGYIVTNHHVVENAETIKVQLYSGETLDAEVVAGDRQTDLAVIKISAQGLHPAVFANSDEVQVGQPVVAIGNPLGTLGESVTEGIISAKDREIVIEDQAMVLLQTTAAINPGNSGGGLFNAAGHLVGIVNAKSSGVAIEGIGFAIPANTVKAVATQLIENGYVTGRPSLGVSVVDADSEEVLAYYGLPERGVYVYHTVYPGGLQQGDRILSVDGQEITAAADIRPIVQGHAVGDTLEIVVVRGNQEKTLQVELRESVPSDAATAA